MGKKELLEDALELYLVTDSRWLGERSLADVVAEAIDGGVTFVQLREKGASTEELVELARPLLDLCREARVPFVIDDDIEAARLVGADGVHIGQSDLACDAAREMLGHDAIIGVSAQTIEQAKAAELAGADYLGVGAMFPTGTKDADVLGIPDLEAICDAVSIPVVAIGGIVAGNAGELKGTGIAGICVVSAIMAASDPRQAASDLRAAFRD